MPLSFDMSYEQLLSYNGRNPRPDDFDDFWDRALESVDTGNIDFSVSRASFNPVPDIAEFFDLWFEGSGGARVYAKMVKPVGGYAKRLAVSGKMPCLLEFHGYSMNSGDWQSKLSLALCGFTVLSMDCRGQGGLSEDTGGVSGNTLSGHIVRGLHDALSGRPDKLLYRNIFLDTVYLAHIAMSLDWVDADRLCATGWSQGGGLTLACAALVPSIRRVAPVYPFLSDYRRVWEMDLAKDAYEELATWFRRFDPMHEREDEVFSALGYIDVQHLVPRIRGDVLWGIGFSDTICPPSSQFAAYNKIVSNKRMLVFPDFGHEDLPGIRDRFLEFFLGL
ncbi:acetylxylan esterase [Spirochaetia bacterium 38H-sp]|uniref:Acetylxylan esterase n=1 Tax=Rarispira pelagica TaxID=3141764 RepID=A0ABU9U8C5_9SPIR